MTVDEELDVLLIEDNPGDVRLIEEMLRDSEKLLQRFDFGERFAGGTRIHREGTLESGLERSSEIDLDVLLLDLGLPDSTGLETLTAVTDATEFVPIVVLTGLSDEGVGIKAIQRGAQDYLVKGEVTDDLLVRSIHYAMERTRQERERAGRREQLETLNRLNEIGQDITHAVITTSEREALERAVCERLVDADAYRFAWIGEVDRVNDRITPRVAAGVEDGYLDEVTISVEDGTTARGPAGTAVRTREVQVMRNVRTDPHYEPWREEAIERGYRSGASVPILYEDVLYGVLNVYASSPKAFSEPEVDILSRLGDVIGHAITAIERKEALVSDTVVELGFQAEDVTDELFRLTAEGESRVEIANVVRTDETVVAYGRTVGISREELREAVTRGTLVDDLRILSSGDGTCEFEIVTTAVVSLVNAVSTHGGRVTSATIADGTLQFVVEFPPGRDKRQLIDLVRDHCPTAVNRAQRLVERGDENASPTGAALLDSLTEKQRIALRTAYFGGLFEWPRRSTGQELADSLGVSPPTFSQHLRAAERKLLGKLFAADTDGTSGSDR